VAKFLGDAMKWAPSLYWHFPKLEGDKMTPTPEPADDGNPKFGRLLLVLLLVVLFCAGLTWVMGSYFPDFPNF
jgi:hypothetical protein